MQLIVLPIPEIQDDVLIPEDVVLTVPMSRVQAIQYILPVDPRIGVVTRLEHAQRLIAFGQSVGFASFQGI